jgi:uncharacterized HAD superfamily protein
MNYKSFDELSEDIKNNLHVIQLGQFDLIVGIPRSGMIPAYMIGLYLNIDVVDFDGFVHNRPLRRGTVRKTKVPLYHAYDAQRILLVDDSIASGNSLKKILSELPFDLKHRVTTMSVYSSELDRNDVDWYLEYLPMPRVFEWNIFHRKLLGTACVDIDGVLCVDPTEEENDDGERYQNFLLNAKPHIIPSYKIHSLVTSRLEKYRPQTEQWLKKYGVEYERLIMLDLPSKEARQKQNAHAVHKARYFKNQKDLNIFIESNVRQAEEIMKYSAKPVYCVDDNIMLKPSMASIVLNNPHEVTRTLKSSIIKRLPNPIIRVLKPIYKLFFS